MEIIERRFSLFTNKFFNDGIIWQMYPIAVVIGTALGLCGSAILRNASINPDVR